MKIQIYKPMFRTRMNERDDSSTFINPEIKNLVLLLRNNNHEVEIASESDDTYRLKGKPDCKILVNGRLYYKGDSLDKKVMEELANVKRIFNNSVPQFQIVTDWKIYERNLKNLNGINFYLLTQSLNTGIDVEYEKLFLINQDVLRSSNKFPQIIYIGNERGGARDLRIKEFLINSGVDFKLFGNWTSFPSQGKVEFEKTRQLLSQYKYSLCLTEDLYIKYQHKTPRIFEGILANNLVFLESKYPTDLKISAFQFVKNGEQLKGKIDFLESHPEIYDYLLANQRRLIESSDLYSGARVYNKLMIAMKHGIN